MLGIYAPVDSLLLDSLARRVGQSLDGEPGWAVYDLRKKRGNQLDSLFREGGRWPPDTLRALGAGTVEMGLAAFCLENLPFLRCRLQGMDLETGLPGRADTMWFDIMVLGSPAELAVELAAGFRRLLSPESSPPVASGGIQFRQALSPALLFKGNLVLARDSVRFFPQGTRLVRGKEGEIVEGRLNGDRYFLYANSAYSFLTPDCIQLDSGRLALVGERDSNLILSPSLRARGKAELLILTHRERISTLRLFRGRMRVRPLLGSQEPQILRDMESFSTRGYAAEVGVLSHREEVQVRRDLESFLAGSLLAQLLAPSALLRDKLFNVENQFRAPAATILEFMRADHTRFGVRSAIPSLEGESWRHEDGNPEAVIRESGCYHCSPYRIDP